MGRERFFFCHSSALWDSGVSGRKGWRYSPKLVEGEFCERRLYGVLDRAARGLLQSVSTIGEPFTLWQGCTCLPTRLRLASTPY